MAEAGRLGSSVGEIGRDWRLGSTEGEKEVDAGGQGKRERRGREEKAHCQGRAKDELAADLVASPCPTGSVQRKVRVGQG